MGLKVRSHSVEISGGGGIQIVNRPAEEMEEKLGGQMKEARSGEDSSMESGGVSKQGSGSVELISKEGALPSGILVEGEWRREAGDWVGGY